MLLGCPYIIWEPSSAVVGLTSVGMLVSKAFPSPLDCKGLPHAVTVAQWWGRLGPKCLAPKTEVQRATILIPVCQWSQQDPFMAGCTG